MKGRRVVSGDPDLVPYRSEFLRDGCLPNLASYLGATGLLGMMNQVLADHVACACDCCWQAEAGDRQIERDSN